MPTRDALATVSELVAQERDRKAAVTAARPEIQPRFAQQRRAAPARDQLEICDRTVRDLEVQFTATWSDGPIFELRERKMRPTRQHNPGRCEAQPNKGRLGVWIVQRASLHWVESSARSRGSSRYIVIALPRALVPQVGVTKRAPEYANFLVAGELAQQTPSGTSSCRSRSRRGSPALQHR